MAEEPDQNFVAYPREKWKPGTPEQLQALGDGFFALSWVLLFSIFVVIFEVYASGGFDTPPEVTVSVMILCAAIIGALAYRPCRKIAYGLGSQPSTAFFQAILLGITSTFCVGIFLIAFLLQRVSTRILEFGVRKRALSSFRRIDIDEAVARLKQNPNLAEIALPVPHSDIDPRSEI